MKDSKTCNTCKTNIVNTEGSTSFSCPSCGKEEIIRCDKCRKISARYTCQSCGYEGP
ncbi:MAG: RNA-binding protein [Nanoarchaeota archaeon]|nr:RNA-binding protein [Nanoarchaeota archaeon]